MGTSFDMAIKRNSDCFFEIIHNQDSTLVYGRSDECLNFESLWRNYTVLICRSSIYSFLEIPSRLQSVVRAVLLNHQLANPGRWPSESM